MPQNKQKKNTRVYGLDFLRVIALLGVLMYHTFPTVWKGGYFGVVLFFVISGYLAGLFVQKDARAIIPYYKKRFLRLYPALFIVVFVSLGFLTIIDSNRMANTPSEVLSIFLGNNNYWQIKMNADYFANLSNSSPFTHLWYIAILIQFELIWPWLARIYLNIKKNYSSETALLSFSLLTLLSFFMMPLSILFHQEPNLTALYYATHTRIFSILSGVLLGLMHRERIYLKQIKQPQLLFLATLVITFILYFTLPGDQLITYILGFSIYTLVALLMVELVAITRNHIGRYLEIPLCRIISQYSYEIYLWQYPVLFFFGILRWNTNFFFYLLQILLIIILSTWLHTFLQRVTKVLKK